MSHELQPANPENVINDTVDEILHRGGISGKTFLKFLYATDQLDNLFNAPADGCDTEQAILNYAEAEGFYQSGDN